MFIISYETQFQASHFVRGYKEKGEPLHEHNWRVEVRLRKKETDETGIAFDFEDLKKETENIVSSLKEKNLNELEDFKIMNPTTENLAKWFHDGLQKRLKGIVEEVRVWEAEGCSIVYRED